MATMPKPLPLPLPSRPRLLLELDFTEPLALPDPDPLARLANRRRPQLDAVLRALHRSGRDPRVAGLIAKVGGSMSWAAMEELRQGVEAFVATGKPTLAWAEDLGEVPGRTAAYVLATAFDEVWLQPGSWLGPLGVGVEATFLRGLLDKLDVEPQLFQRHEYKSAAELFTRDSFSPAQREADEAVVRSVFETAVASIASGRSMDPQRVRELADAGPIDAHRALQEGLVDATGYRDEAYAHLRTVLGPVRLLLADRWRPVPASPLRPRRRGHVSLVEVRGAIAPGRSRHAAIGRIAGSDTVGSALRSVARDDGAKAVVLRVDSPGGSAVASDSIWREVCRVREAGKPVIVSMGGLAASGGYFVACPGDVIVALPSTVTGSIGVVAGKLVVGRLLRRMGITSDRVVMGQHTLMGSAREPFTEEQLALLDHELDTIYADFVAKVAQGRGMTVEQVEPIARGRVWTGRDAQGIGLVDELGGLRTAMHLAKLRGGLPESAPVILAGQVPALRRLGRPRNTEDPRAAQALHLPAAGLGALAQATLLAPVGRVRG